MSMISVIVPCFNEEAGLPYFFPEIRKLANKMFANYGILFEILFIDDGSEDKTLELLRELAVEDDRVHYIAFSRNFGKEAAIYAGMQRYCRSPPSFPKRRAAHSLFFCQLLLLAH